MANMVFDGPVEVSPELAFAMWEAVPAENKPAVALAYFCQFGLGKLGESAIKAGVVTLMEKEGIGKAGAKAIRDAVSAKCLELGTKSVQPEAVAAIVSDEIKKSVAALVTKDAATLLAMVPKEKVVEAALPVIVDIFNTVAHRYFHGNPEGQRFILDSIEAVKMQYVGHLQEAVYQTLATTAEPTVQRVIGPTSLILEDDKPKRKRKGLDNGEH